MDVVEQLVQGDELRPFDVPVCLLALTLEIQRVGETLVEQLDDLLPGGRWQVVAGGEQGIGGGGGAHARSSIQGGDGVRQAVYAGSARTESAASAPPSGRRPR